MSPDVAQVRADICGDCPTPCDQQRNAAHYGDPCAACLLTPPRWRQWDCDPATPALLPGDRLAAEIERRVLAPVDQHAPGIVAAVRRCGGCTQTKHALGSADPHPDPGTVV